MKHLQLMGLKCSIFCCILSAWGIIQLGTMGLLFHARSVAFAEDVPEVLSETGSADLSQFYRSVDEGYDASAFNCWIGASIYCAFLVFSLCQCAVNFTKVSNGKLNG